jgi:hypothetical protein
MGFAFALRTSWLISKALFAVMRRVMQGKGRRVELRAPDLSGPRALSESQFFF